VLEREGGFERGLVAPERGAVLRRVTVGLAELGELLGRVFDLDGWGLVLDLEREGSLDLELPAPALNMDLRRVVLLLVPVLDKVLPLSFWDS